MTDPHSFIAEQKRADGLRLCRDVLIIGTLAIWGLGSGAGFLVPLVLAVLAFVLIISVSDRIRAIRIGPLQVPRWFANLVSLGFVSAGLLSVISILATQASELVSELPKYQGPFDSTLERLARLVGEDLADMFRGLVIDIDTSQFALTAAGGAGAFLSTFFLICIYSGFMMAERRSFNAKIQLAAADRKTGSDISELLEAIAYSMQRYLSIKSFLSLLTAGISYPVFKLIGLDFAETWGVLTFALNFIPTIGSIVAVIFPALMALVQFDTITPFLIVVFGCGTVQFLIGNVLDPTLLGRSLNMSSFMVVLSLMFWTAVWGIPGAFLSVPLTVCILIVFSHIPATRPVAILLSQRGLLLTPAQAMGKEKDKE
ncbi:AI-2E family transporter [Chachezhania antarctica]|uniref:AI-2E family transporter n=1 Tax=Chachezhania antarctica TaxID=2340860 RepID=UPI000EAF3F31|nr:AI-2E family transporter [Chachezhania antarctica]